MINTSLQLGSTDPVPGALKSQARPSVPSSRPNIKSRDSANTTLVNQTANMRTLSDTQDRNTRTVSVPSSQPAQPVARQSQAQQTYKKQFPTPPPSKPNLKKRPPLPQSKPRITSYSQVLNRAQHLYNNDKRKNLDTFISNFLKDLNNRLQKIDKKTLGEWEQKLKKDMTPKKLPPPPTNKPNLLSVEEIVKSLQNNATENSAKYPIGKLITIAKNSHIYGCSVDDIVKHLITQKDNKSLYSNSDTIKILKEIKMFLLSGSILGELGTYLNSFNWNVIEEDLFREFGKTVCSEYVKACTFAILKKGMECGTLKLAKKIESDLEQRITAMENMRGKSGNIIKSKFRKNFFTGIREIDNQTKQELEKHYKK